MGNGRTKGRAGKWGENRVSTRVVVMNRERKNQ